MKELVSEDRRFKPKHQTMIDEPKTAINQEVQLHQKSEAEPWKHHLRKKRSVPIGKGCQNFAQGLKPSDNGGKEVEHNEKRGGRKKTAVNDQRNFVPRLKELVSEDRRFKPTHQMSDEPKLLFIRKYNCIKSQKQNRGISI